MIKIDRIEATCEVCKEECCEAIRIQLEVTKSIFLCDDCAEVLIIMINNELEPGREGW